MDDRKEVHKGMYRRNDRMKRLLSMAMSAAVLLGLAGCGEQTEGVGQVADKTVITALYHQSLETFEQLVETTYEDIDLVVELDMLATYNQDNLLRLRSDHGDDLIFTSTPNGEVADYMLDLSAEEFSTYYKDLVMDTIRKDGHTIYLPMPSVYSGILMNESLVKELGYAMPDSNQALLEILQAAKDAGVGVGEDNSVFAFNQIDTYSFGEAALGVVVPDFLGTMDGERWSGSFINKEAKMQGMLDRYLTDLFVLAEEGYLDASRLISSNFSRHAVDVEKRMAERELVAAFATSDVLREIRQKNTGDTFSMLPHMGTGERPAWVTTAPTSYLGINQAVAEDAEKLDACKRILKLFSTAEGQRAILADTNADNSYLLSEVVEGSGASDTGLEQYVAKGYVYNLNRFDSEVLALFGNNIAGVCKGELSLSEALSKVDTLNQTGELPDMTEYIYLGTAEETLWYQNYNTRLEETEIGNLISDAVAEIAEVDIAVVNGGMIRSSLYMGDVYTGDLKAICPYDNNIIILEMTGKVLLEMIENGLQELYYTGTPGGRFLQVHGLNYAFSVDKSAEKITDTESIPAKTELLSVTLADGTPVDEKQIYTVAVSSYMCGASGYDDGGGDGYTMLNVFDDAVPKAKGVTLVQDTGLKYMDALVKYFENHTTEAVTAKLDGRITIEEVNS